MEERNIEETFLKGVTPKLIVSLFIGWSSLLVTILLTYGSIKSTFDIQDMRLNSLENAIKIEDLQIKDLYERVNENKSNIGILKSKSDK